MSEGEDAPEKDAEGSESEAENPGKSWLLDAAFEDARKTMEQLEQKKGELQQKLDEIREKEGVAEGAEREIEQKLKDLLRIEARFEEVLSEEERLRREESLVEDDLLKVKAELGKIKKMFDKIGKTEG